MKLLLAAALWVASAARGTLVVPQSIEELTRTSDAVVRGTVTKLEARWSPDHHLIYTFVTLRVEAAIKGVAIGEIVVQRPGGSVDGVGQRVHGNPEFKNGERVVLFLVHLPVQVPMFRVQGMSQGKLTLQSDGDGALQALQDTRDLSFMREGQITPGGVLSMPAAELVARIKQAAGTR